MIRAGTQPNTASQPAVGAEPRRSILIRLPVAGLPFCVALAALVPWLGGCDAVTLDNREPAPPPWGPRIGYS